MTRDHAAELRRELADPRDLAALLGLDEGAKRQADGVTVLCPWHEERSPSCSITTGSDGTVRVHCFGCDAGGDALSLIAQVNGLDLRTDFKRVLIEAAELAGRRDILDDLGADHSGIARKARDLVRRGKAAVTAEGRPLHSVSSLPAATYHAIASALLELSPIEGDGAEYLQSRGLLAAARGDRWGAMPRDQRPIFDTLRRQFDPADLVLAGLVDERRQDRLVRSDHRIVIPWRNETGQIDVLQRRTVGEPVDASVPKYVFPLGRKPASPYGADRIAEAGAIAYVEGAVDVLALRAYLKAKGKEATVVGLPGLTWVPPWGELARGRAAFVAIDADKAGDDRAPTLALNLYAAGAIQVNRLRPSGGKDWGEIWATMIGATSEPRR